MADSFSSNTNLGGVYGVGFSFNDVGPAGEENIIYVDIHDEVSGLMFDVRTELTDEEDDEERLVESYSVTIPENERNNFAQYLRQAAQVIQRDRQSQLTRDDLQYQPQSPVRLQQTNLVFPHDIKPWIISFGEAGNMLQSGQIEKYVVDPSLQSSTGSQNKTVTLFGKNGITYLVRARYDEATNQIFPPN
ncbi:hypothetical protein BH23THE1_BH23THE1_34340 [soil metagenome]